MILSTNHGIGVIAETYEYAALMPETSDQLEQRRKAEGFDSVKAYALYHKTAGIKVYRARWWKRSGDVAQALRSAYKTYDIEYNTDFATPDGALNAVVSVAADGKSAEAWVGSPGSGYRSPVISETLNIDFSQVTLHLLSGRRFYWRSMVTTMSKSHAALQ